MAEYYVMYAFMALALGAAIILPGSYRFALLLGTVPVAVFSLIRGPVGTDTWMYIAITENIGTVSDSEQPIEWAFVQLLKLAKFIAPDSATAVNLVAAFSVLLFICAALLLSRSAVIILLGTYVPYLLIENSFNGLRIGIAVSLLLLAGAIWDRNKHSAAFLIALLAISIHVSSLLVVGLFLLQRAKNVSTHILGSAFMALIVLSEFGSRIFEKVDFYQAQVNDTSARGLGVAVMLWAVAVISYKSRRNYSGMLLAIAGTVLILAGGNYPYASIRIVTLLFIFQVFSLVLGVSRLSARESQTSNFVNGTRSVPTEPQNSFTLVSLVIATFVASSILRLNNIDTPNIYGLSPFVPFQYLSDFGL